MVAEVEQILRQDVLDEVAATGHVGLHELVWSLRTEAPELTDDERVAIAKRVAEDLLASSAVVLRTFQWPGDDPLNGPLGLDAVPEGAWLESAEDGTYPAFVEASTAGE